mmetsp:Transcript_24493/g.28349  ORF Transcript_24493/g.28349 Transcript_24493/m.28349 type:complete len:283 (-) Transcript_24493:82-930(-)
MTQSTVVAPQYKPGFTHLKKECFILFSCLSIAYFLLLIPGSYLTPADQFCKQEPCIRPSLFAFEGICGSVFIIMAYQSFRSWHVRKTPQKEFPQTPEGRVYGYSAESEKLAALSFVFQAWSVVFTPFIPEFYSSIMMGHHFMAALVSYLALQYQYYHYYVVFFLALTEVSSIPLVMISLGKYFPTAFSFAVPIAQPLFVIGFAYYRVFLWNKVSFALWKDAIHVLSKGVAEQYRPKKSFCLYIILTIDVILGFLQLFWFTMIVGEILKVLGINVPDINVGFE